jgi:hypothetical protein
MPYNTYTLRLRSHFAHPIIYKIFSDALKLSVSPLSPLVMTNLVRNYSPIKPDVASAPSTAELFNVLHDSSRVMLMRYLRRVRDLCMSRAWTSDPELDTVSHRLVSYPLGTSRSPNGHTLKSYPLFLLYVQIVNTVFVKLLVEMDQRAEAKDVLQISFETIVWDEVRPTLEAYGHVDSLLSIYRRLNDEPRLLDLLSKYNIFFLRRIEALADLSTT